MGRTLVLLALAAAAFAAASEAKYTKEEEEAMMIEFNEHSQWPRLRETLFDIVKKFLPQGIFAICFRG